MRIIASTNLRLGLIGLSLFVVLGANDHMTTTVSGPKISVVLNDTEVSTINLDEWNTPGKRPDGSEHKFSNVAIGKLPRHGYFGFQDHGSDCLFLTLPDCGY